jgi:hypothetical protein
MELELAETVCSPSLRMSMAATFRVRTPGRE